MKWSRTAGLFLGLFLLIVILFLVTGSPSFADTPGIVVSPTTGLYTTEAGGTAIFTIVLNTSPTYDVVIPLFSSNISEGIVSTPSVTFTTANWNIPQTVTVTGVDDGSLVDGDIAYVINTSASISTDPAYNNLPVADVTVTNSDNDFTLISVSPATGLGTTEAGGTATFSIVLTKLPTFNVTIGLSSSDLTEGNMSPPSVTFTNTTWYSPQTVTITGADDFVIDGNIPYVIITAPASSSDGNYSGKNAADVSVKNYDNDSVGITVNPTSGLVTTEAGGIATFTIKLNTQPTANVTIGLSSSDTGEGTVSPSSVTFTNASGNWSTQQTVTVTGVSDTIVDGNQSYTIITAAATSIDPYYSGFNAADVSVVNTDTPGVNVYPTSGLVTTEAGGTASFNIVLNTSPTSAVVIGITSNDPSEGTVSPPSVTFTAGNWNAPQMVTVTGRPDATPDGNTLYNISTSNASSSDTNYNGKFANNVSVTNIDNDQAGISVNPTSGLVTTEAGGTAYFTIVLNNRSTYNVLIAMISNDSGEGTVSPDHVDFTSSDWNQPQTVTVTGQDDFLMDGNQLYNISILNAVSSDPNYHGKFANNVSVTNIDNDTAGVTVNPTLGLFTSETGGTANFTIVLNSKPADNVSIGLSSNDSTEGIVSPASVTFGASNWSSPRTVTVTGQDDALVDGNILYNISTSNAVSSDADYNGKFASNVSVTNIDDESAGITVNPTSGLVTTEAGGTATFTIVLTNPPTAPVTIGLSSSNTSEGTVSPASVTFGTSNWSTLQLVTVHGQDDFSVDGNISYTIITAPASSSDTRYNNMPVNDVRVTNTDNDIAGITVNPTSGLVTTEAGGTANFTIKLNTQPAYNVIIGLNSSDPTEGTVSPSSVTFTPSDWNTTQTVTVTGVPDASVDGNVAYTIITANTSSSDPNYSNLPVNDVSVTNNDTSTGCVITPSKPQAISPGNGSANLSISVTLNWSVCTNASSYDVYLSTSPTLVFNRSTTNTSYSVSLNYSTKYYWQVVANSSCGNTNASDTWSFTTTCAIIPARPQTPYPGNGSANLSTSVTLNWSACTNATSYDVYLGTSPTLAFNRSTTNTSYSVSLNYSTRYYWQVVANSSCGNTNASDIWSFATLCTIAPSKPQTPSPVNGSVNISTSVTLNWSVCANATSYDVYLNTSSTPTYRGNTSNSSYQVSLNYSTQYYWKVVANNSCGTNSSDVWNFTTASVPVSTPTPTISFDIGGTKASWNTSSNGVIQQAVDVTSSDGMINLHIPAGTRAWNSEDEPLDELNMSRATVYPNASGDRTVIAAFNFDPDGATFVPGIVVTLSYTHSMIPAGVNESDLIVASYNESSRGWEYYNDRVVNTMAHTITFTVSHFTTFTIQTPSIHGGGLGIWVIMTIVFAAAIILGVAGGLYIKYRRVYGSLYYEDEGDEDDKYSEYTNNNNDNKDEGDFKF